MNALTFDVRQKPDPARRCAAVVVAIPANNEADRIETCLSALAAQRDRWGRPVQLGAFEILVYANNCSDGTEAIAREFGRLCPHTVVVASERLPADRANAGWARKRAMDLAASRLMAAGRRDGLILTTDADSQVAPTWVDNTRRAIAEGADCVAGYVDAVPLEWMRLGKAFIDRGRLEDVYLSAIAEIYALCDPRPHDPWPNHRVSSGASLAVTLEAYRAIGGLPPKAVGEDAALTAALETGGFRVRHSLNVCVTTSCRLDGRARGGAADTMRLRQEVAHSPCDDELEPAFRVLRRALLKGSLRRRWQSGDLEHLSWARHAGLIAADAESVLHQSRSMAFEGFWANVVEASPALRVRHALRPCDLPRQISRAQMCLRALRRAAKAPPETVGPADIPLDAAPSEWEDA